MKKVEDLITDLEIQEVFLNTNFGSEEPRETIARNLKQVKSQFAIGSTAKCCLIELDLIVKEGFFSYSLTSKGEQYLEILNK